MQRLERPEKEKREARSHGHQTRPCCQGSTCPCDDRAVNPNRLRDIEIFSHLSKSELERVAGWLQTQSVPAGHQLVREGAFAHEFFLIEDGEASVLQDGEHIATLGPGDFFGEIGLIETERRTASVVATTPVDVIVMFRPEFEQMKKELPTVADQIQAAIRARLDK
jgi:CRP/FNR family transcriptional regulator, cyclic AMP receptor protein